MAYRKPIQEVKPYDPSDTNWAPTIESDDELCMAADSGSEEESDGPRIRQTNYLLNARLNAPERNRPERKASKKTNYFPEVVFHKFQEFRSKIKSSPIFRKLQSEIESRPILQRLWSRIKSRPILVSFLVVLFLFLIIPGPISPVAVDLPTYKHREMNAELKKAKRLFEEEIQGPEAFVVDKDGNMFTGLGDGRVVRFTDRNIETVVRLGPPPYGRCGQMNIEDETRCGRPLGLAIASSTAPYDLHIADCYHGILVYNLMTKELTTLLNTTIPREGIPPMKLINSIALLSNGSIFFTDSSSKFGRADVLSDILEGAGNGKLMHYDPSTEALSVVVSDMAFPNGICVSPSEDFLLVVETTRARIMKYYLSGPKVGTTDVFADNLPGVPDNISPASTGGYWVGSGASRHKGYFDLLSRSPWIKSVIAKLRLTRLIYSLVPKSGMIYRLSSDGEILEVLWDSDGAVIEDVSSVLDMGDKLYLGSYSAPYMGRLDLR